MAWTASTNPEQEYYESVHSVDEKALLLANLIKQSEHFIVFTGAGISTSAGKS
jgi:formylmethanofuran dehydrogenase subunit B